MPSTSHTVGDLRSENGHGRPVSSPAVQTPQLASYGPAGDVLRETTNDEASRASYSGNSTTSRYGDRAPPSAWMPTNGVHGSLLEDSPSSFEYDPLQHFLLAQALAWYPVVGEVVSPSSSLRIAPLPSPPIAQHPGSQAKGDRAIQPGQSGFVVDPPLPQSAYDLGFTDADFNPRTIWHGGIFDKDFYRDYPNDLQDTQIMNGIQHCIAFGNLLRLATRYTNDEIFEQCNKDRSQPVFTTKAIISTRIATAIKWAEKNWNIPGGRDGIKAWLDAERNKNGLLSRRRHKRKREDDEESHVVEAEQGNRLYVDMPSKRIKTTETVATAETPRTTNTVRIPEVPQTPETTQCPETTDAAFYTNLRQLLEQELYGSSPSVQDSSTSQQSTSSIQYSTPSTTATTPSSKTSTPSAGQKKRKRDDEEQTDVLGTNEDVKTYATPSKRLNMRNTMPAEQADAFKRLSQTLLTPAQQTPYIAHYAAAQRTTTPATGLARTAAIQEALMTPRKISHEDWNGYQGRIQHQNQEQYRFDNGGFAVNMQRVDSGMASIHPGSNASAPIVID